MDNENGEEVILNTSEESVDLDTTQEESEEEFDWKTEALKQKQIAENQKIRAEKLERKAKEGGREVVKETKSSSASTEDLYALMKADIPQEDIADVREYAQFKGISIAEALQTGAVRSILAEKVEQRTVASATNTGNSKRSSGKISDEALLANANSGKLPENDADLNRLVQLKMKQGAGRR